MRKFTYQAHWYLSLPDCRGTNLHMKSSISNLLSFPSSKTQDSLYHICCLHFLGKTSTLMFFWLKSSSDSVDEILFFFISILLPSVPTWYQKMLKREEQRQTVREKYERKDRMEKDEGRKLEERKLKVTKLRIRWKINFDFIIANHFHNDLT